MKINVKEYKKVLAVKALSLLKELIFKQENKA
ncbi:MAG: hypothetical protein CM15mP14_1970 [Rhodospirillaceae bacterium]|nr:MAG: hypothetical protein CM15mP14_1970 [Rhodospirillaceae bacterium]